MKRPIVLLSTCAFAAFALVSCSGAGGSPGGESQPKVVSTEAGCTATSDCPAGQVCLHGECIPAPTDGSGNSAAPDLRLAADPQDLSFGTVAASASKTLSLTVSNTGDGVVELSRVEISPVASTFRVESLGTGPFWIRPGRNREILVTYEPGLGGANAATLTIRSAAPDVTVSLNGS